MKNEKTKWMQVEAADIAIGGSYIAFGLSALLLGSDLVATLLDSKLFPMRLLFDASFAVWGLLLRYFGKKYKNKTN
jgi:hypothetical protein